MSDFMEQENSMTSMERLHIKKVHGSNFRQRYTVEALAGSWLISNSNIRQK
jgi:hypothetical protein